jgi:hypothetical protein
MTAAGPGPPTKSANGPSRDPMLSVMVRRHARTLLAVSLMAISAAGCGTEAEESAVLFLSRHSADESPLASGKQASASQSTDLVALARRAADIPEGVTLRQRPETFLLEVIAQGESRREAARVANHLVDQLATEVNESDQGLGDAQFVVVEYAQS